MASIIASRHEWVNIEKWKYKITDETHIKTRKLMIMQILLCKKLCHTIFTSLDLKIAWE